MSHTMIRNHGKRPDIIIRMRELRATCLYLRLHRQHHLLVCNNLRCLVFHKGSFNTTITMVTMFVKIIAMYNATNVLIMVTFKDIVQTSHNLMSYLLQMDHDMVYM